VIKDSRLYIQAGAGIVADSVPAYEWNETMNKARAIFRAVSMVAARLDNGYLLNTKTKTSNAKAQRRKDG
jgi:anthranilate synthase component 1